MVRAAAEFLDEYIKMCISGTAMSQDACDKVSSKSLLMNWSTSKRWLVVLDKDWGSLIVV